MSRHFNINVILVLKLNFFNMSASQFFYKEFINSLYNKHMSELDREYPNIVICALERIWKKYFPNLYAHFARYLHQIQVTYSAVCSSFGRAFRLSQIVTGILRKVFFKQAPAACKGRE